MRRYDNFGSADAFDGGDLFGDFDMVGMARKRSRKKTGTRRKSSRRASAKRVSFVTKSGKRVSFNPKNKRSRKATKAHRSKKRGAKRPYPHHLKKWMFKKKR